MTPTNNTTRQGNPEIRSCPSCGCQLDNHGWRNCPRCQQELTGCSGCGNCKCGR